ncbi:replication-associated recombination protein A [Mycoplasmopsis opalescens]|uniref:replication-associated recombination protein A n=1 Tax=Mycoplasmopsis opalescens TaxID=114886 RepID=UPI0004A75E40|nr:replication-associated recombination protein A [Mycoplasmopsis opalescens]
MKNLANEARPKKIEDIIGQERAINVLKKVVERKLSYSFIFFGESGTGKTSSAIAYANELQKTFTIFNASIDNKTQLIEKLQSYELIIIDEIHRLNKNLQDILLSYLEYDKVIVVATTTENPYFRINPALRSRMQILQFNKLTNEEIIGGVSKIIDKYYPKLTFDSEALESLVSYSAGDYRNVLNNLQMLALVNEKNKITKEDIKKIIPNINFYADSNASAHYNNLSAFHKSLRGSDVDAALYYGHLIIETGDYQGLFRRITAVAYEDIGLADPNIILRVEAALNAVERLGFPEAELPLTFIIISLALAPKSNSVYQALQKSHDTLAKGKIYEIPKHLRDAHYASSKKLGDGLNYLYPHDFSKSLVAQEYLPQEIKNLKLFEFHENDNEKIKKQYELINKINKGGRNG